MNDQTPRRLGGSLLERAAEIYHFGEPLAAPPAPRPAPVAEPEPPLPPRMLSPVAPAAQPVAPLPVAEPEPVVELEPEPEPDVFALTEIAEEAPAPAQPALRRGWDPELEVVRNQETPPSVVSSNGQVAHVDRDALAEAGMLVPGGPVTPLAEEFRLVKRQLLLTARAVAGADADKARMVLVCSAQSGEGKTFCAINLALSMAAEMDMQILLVDADFAQPDVLARLGLPPGPGLLDVLQGAVEHAEQCIIDTDIPQLSILPAGTRSNSDTELLASDRARAILDGLAAANPRRIVIFDSPPALAASPASVLASLVGQVMLVVRADQTSESDLREAVAMLDGCEHIQLVLNAVSFQPGGRRFGSYYGEPAK